MFIPLVDSLRCPKPHDATWLVASIDHAEERDMKRGVLGCPTCLAEYPVRDGIVYFDEDVPRAPFVPADEQEAMRIAATLDLVDARMTALLLGAWGAQAPLVRTMSPAHLLLLNPPEGVVSGDGVSIIMSHVVPVAESSMDAAAIDENASEGIVALARAALRGGRRMLGPVSRPLPAWMTELARDAHVWVAELDSGAATSAPVPLTTRPRTGHQ